MKITAQEEYGLRCLLRLAHVRDEQYLTIPEVAAAEQLSVPYVAKLLNHYPWLRRLPARLIGMGFRPEHVSQEIRDRKPEVKTRAV